ncbi:MAG: ABC transporter permease [Candidatus Magasanikbacteria bacterium]
MKKYAIIGPILFIFAWFAVSQLQLVDSVLLTGPTVTIEKLYNLIITGEILDDLWATLWRIFVAFSISTLLGVPLGLGLGSSKKLYTSIEFIVDFFRSTPVTALLPMFILFFGVSNMAKIAVAAFASFLIILFNTAYGVMHASKARVMVAEIMGASKMQIFRTVLFWESLPQTFVGIRNAVSIAFIVIILAEMLIGTQHGLGNEIIDAQTTYEISTMYAVILLTGIIGYGLNLFFNLLEKSFLHWSSDIE